MSPQLYICWYIKMLGSPLLFALKKFPLLQRNSVHEALVHTPLCTGFSMSVCPTHSLILCRTLALSKCRHAHNSKRCPKPSSVCSLVLVPSFCSARFLPLCPLPCGPSVSQHSEVPSDRLSQPSTQTPVSYSSSSQSSCRGRVVKAVERRHGA